MGGYGLGVCVHVCDLLAETAGYARCLIPCVIVCDDLIVGFLSRKYGRQHNAIVVAARLGVEKGNIPGIWLRFDNVFQHTARGHAGTDDDQFLLHSAASCLLYAASIMTAERAP